MKSGARGEPRTPLLCLIIIVMKIMVGGRWSRVIGIIGVVINILLDIGWKPVRPDLFVSDNGQQWQSERRRFDIVGLPLKLLSYAIKYIMHNTYWTLAGQSHCAGRVDYRGYDLH